MIKDTTQVKNKIIEFLRLKGPNIPAYIAQNIKTEMIITSALLSELKSEKKIQMSHMKVGSSPVYFLEEQRKELEEFSKYLKSKEKEAFELIQEKKILQDEKQEPAIRIALRNIRDFAIPFKKNEKIFWRYFKNPEKEEIEITEIPKQEQVQEKQETKEKTKKKKTKLKKPKKTASEKKNQKFFDKVKEFLEKNNIEIIGIQGFTKNSLILKIKENSQEKLLIAYNKKRITEEDIIKAHKKSVEEKMKYDIISLGEPYKKTNSFIKAIKNLSEIKKIE